VGGADQTLVAQAATSNPIDSEYGREVYMVEQGGELLEKTTEELQQEAEKEIACVERLAQELYKRKGHNGLQDSGSSEDEHPDRAPTGRHHPKFNSRCHSDRDRFRHRSRLIHEEFGRVEYLGEQVYRTLAHNALASSMLMDQITPSSPRIMKQSTRMSSGSWQCWT
jgi:hypothetical protein